MTRAQGLVVLLALGCALTGADRAPAQQALLLDPVTGFLRMEYDGFATAYSTGFGSTRHGLHERIRARLRGALYDPDFLTFDLGLEPYGRQSAYRSDGATDNRGRSVALNGYYSLQILSERALSLSLTGSRSDHWYNDAYGVRTETDQRRLGGRLRYRNAWLPLSLEYERLGSRVDWRRGGETLDGRHFTTRKLVLKGENSKTHVRVHRLEYEDVAREFALREELANLRHRLSWGKGSALASAFTHTDRSQNGVPYVSTRWTQSSHLQHTPLVGSDFFYGLHSGEVLGRPSGGYSSSASTTVRITETVEAGVQAAYDRLDQGGTGTTYLRAGSRAAYNREFLGGLVASVGAGAGIERQHRRTPGAGDIRVENEVHVLPESGVIQLPPPHVDFWTVRVASADGTDEYREYHDYLVVVHDPFVEIHDLAQGRIEPGDSLAVSYTYRLTDGFDARYGNLSIALTKGGLGFHHRRYLRGGVREQLDGASLSLADLDDMTTGITYASAGAWGAAQGTVEHRRQQSDYGRHDGIRGRARYQVAVTPRLSGSLGASVSRTEGRGRQSRHWGTGASALFQAREGLSITGALNAASWTAGQLAGTNLAAGASVNWTFGAVVARARYDHYWWRQPGEPDDSRDSVYQNRLLLTVTRTF